MINTVDKLWGSEQWIVNDTYCAKLLNIKPGWQCSLHYHPIKTETFMLLGDGMVFLEVGDKHRILRKYETVTIQAGARHRFGLPQTWQPVTLLEISSHHDDADVVRLEESCPWAAVLHEES